MAISCWLLGVSSEPKANKLFFATKLQETIRTFAARNNKKIAKIWHINININIATAARTNTITRSMSITTSIV